MDEQNNPTLDRFGYVPPRTRHTRQDTVIPVPIPGLRNPATATIVLSANPRVQELLQLNLQQMAEVDRLASDFRRQMTRLRSEIAQLPPNDRAARRAEMQPEFEALTQETATRIAAELNAAQRDRLQPMRLQLLGVRAVIVPDIAEELQLSEHQLTEIKGLLRARGPDVRSLSRMYRERRIDRAAGQEAWRGLVAALEQDVQSVLSPEQGAVWDQLRGEPFDLEFLRAGFE